MTPQRPALRQQERLTLMCGDCRDVMAELPECSIDAIVTDPPYDLTNRTPDVKACVDCGRVLGGNDGRPDDCPRCGGVLVYQRSQAGRGFMGKSWDGTGVAFDPETWRAALRVLKPGGHLLAFGGPRTFHRLACAIEDAGFEVRDCLMYMFGSGFPKSLNLHDEWEGWGTALKPAYEPIILARKPLQGTVAANVQRWDTGALHIEACRIGNADTRQPVRGGHDPAEWGLGNSGVLAGSESGRWPANVLLDTEAACLLDAMSGELVSNATGTHFKRNSDADRGVAGAFAGNETEGWEGSRGGASRFFYTAKASRSEREFGLDDLPPLTPGELTGRKDGAKGTQNPRAGAGREQTQTVKLDSWVSEVLEAALLADMDKFLRRVTDGFTTMGGSEWSTMLSGKMRTEPSQKGTKSTISTETSSITDSTISDSSIQSRINAFILDAISLMESGLSPAEYAACVSQLMQRIGISQPRAGLTTAVVAPVISEQLFALSKKGGLPSRVITAKRRNDHPT